MMRSLRRKTFQTNLLDQEFCREAASTSRGRKLDAQKFCLHSVHAARLACGVRRGVNGLILRVDIGHGALQNDADRRRRGPEDRLPAHGSAAIGHAREAWNRELATRLGAAGKSLIVEAKAHVPGEK